jgi:flagella basal body P-ring formation protein FlgA
MATRFHVDAPGQEICVERTVHAPDPDQVLAAMRKVLPAAKIEILELSRHPIPDGELEFKLDGLREGPAGTFWNGNIRYGENHTLPVWVRLSIHVSVPRVIATADLAPGQAISAEMIRVEYRDEFPGHKDYAQSADQVLGRLPRGPLHSGAAVRVGQLEAPKDVVVGETVRVDVWDGAAHLKLEARAEATGTRGQTIPVRNLDSQKRFLARVDGKGRVSIGDPAAEDDHE